jgi:hypothetical protein
LQLWSRLKAGHDRNPKVHIFPLIAFLVGNWGGGAGLSSMILSKGMCKLKVSMLAAGRLELLAWAAGRPASWNMLKYATGAEV